MNQMTLQQFGIYAPVMGEREDFPNILLQNAFTPDNSNVHIWDGELRACKMRAEDLFRPGYEIADVDLSSDTVDISGDYSAIFTSTDYVVLYNSTSSEVFQLSADSVYSGDTTLTTIYLSGDLIAGTPQEYIATTSDILGTTRASSDFLQVMTPDGEEILHYHTFISPQGDERLCAFTAEHVYAWNHTSGAWTEIFDCGTCTAWSTTNHNGYLCATNNVNFPQYWDGNLSTSMSGIDTATSGINYASGDYLVSAEFIYSYENYLIVANVTYASGGTAGRNYIYWSSLGLGVGASSDWDIGGTGDAGGALIEGAGDITGGMAIYKGMMIVFKSKSCRKVWFTGGSLVFQQANINTSVGCSAPGSIINDEDGDLYFYGSDHTFREIARGRIGAAVNKTARSINSEILHKIRSHYIDEYDEVWWSIPYGPDSTANNKTLVYKKSDPGLPDAWMERTMGVSAFGKYSQQETEDYTWDTLPWNTWEDWPWDSWDNAVDSNADFPIEICAGTSGDTYRVNSGYLDQGEDVEKHFVLSTDMTGKQALAMYKRMLKVYLYARSESGCTLNFSTISDNAGYLVNESSNNWQSQGSVTVPSGNQISRQELAVDVRARHFLLKIGVSSGEFSFIGIEFEYVFDGAE